MDITPILHDKYDNVIRTCPVITGTLTPSKSLEVMTILKKKYPLNRLSHLKRICSLTENGTKYLYVIICCYADNFRDNLAACLSEDVLKENVSDLKVSDVPISQPLTRKQFEMTKKVWPTVFHEDKYLTRLQSSNFFSSQDLKRIELFMSTAISCAKSGLQKGGRPIGAVIVDPKTDAIIAKAYDCTSFEDPLQHAVMVCIDMVSRTQNADALSCNDERELSGFCGYSGTKISHNLLMPVPEVATKESSQSDFQSSSFAGDLITPKITKEGINGVNASRNSIETTVDEKANLKRKSPVDEQYLCTGYELYTTHEPCPMCAMALTHSRIQRVFYGTSNEEMGSLGCIFKIHCQEGLNHHYEVFTNVLRDKCLELGRD